ncbi:TPA: hypothetical protein ACGW54_003940 [Bacillus tropicus]
MISNNEGTVSKRKGKRVKKELRTFATQTIGDLFEKFYHAKVAEDRAERTLHQYKENFRYFTYFLDYKSLSRNIDTITTDVIRNYVVFMKNEKRTFISSPVPSHIHLPAYKTLSVSFPLFLLLLLQLSSLLSILYTLMKASVTSALGLPNKTPFSRGTSIPSS